MNARPIRYRRDANDLVDLFLRARPHGTRRGYEGALRALARWMGAGSVQDAVVALLGGARGEAHDLVLRWRCYLIETGSAPATISARIAAVKALCNLARLRGDIAWHLEVSGIRRTPVRDMRGPPATRVHALLAQAAMDESPIGIRNLALLRLLYDLALRRGEAIGLDIEDVDVHCATIRIRGKGNVDKSAIALPAPTRDALAAWLAVRDADSGPVFVGMSRGREPTRLTGTSVARIVRCAGEAVGIQALRPHALRHAAITAALEATGGDVRAVQRFSRHASVGMVIAYDDARRDGAADIARMVAAPC